MKKVISSFLAILIILLSFCNTLLVFAADAEEYTQNRIIVDFRGTEVYLDVFVSENGTILVPSDILNFFGGLKRISDGSEYIYSESGSDPELWPWQVPDHGLCRWRSDAR